MPPKISIVIPCFNDGRYLPEAVASAKAQTYPNTEIIIVDDHSTDPATCDLLQKISTQGVRVLSTPENKKGLPAARNTGIAAATGKYILPLDADDIIAPTYMEKGVAVLENRPEVGICYCKARLFGLKRGSWNLPQYSWKELLKGNMIFATALFRKTDWELAGEYDESLTHGFEDYAFWLHLITLGRGVVRLEEELFSYRIKPSSMIAAMATNNHVELALEEVHRSCEPILSKNSLLLFKHVHRLQQEKGELTCLVSWKLLRHVFALEWRLRQIVKRIIGRA